MHVEVLYGKLPDDVKWRGIALANFDGQRWWNTPHSPTLQGLSDAPLDLPQAAPTAFYSGGTPPPRLPTLRYRVVMEPLGLDLFFLAPVPLTISGDYRYVGLTQDGSVVLDHPSEVEAARSVSVYTAEADARNPEVFVRDSKSTDYPPGISHLYLQLPRVDPRVRELARSITASAVSNYARAKAVETYLKTNFGYTLELPVVKEQDPLAAFLFERKRGHCEYFATSMTIMLRTEGIPARLVNGFRGGEYNDLTGNYIVRDRDAHSWVEAYFPEFGWVTFDPTPAAQVSQTGRLSRLELYLDAGREMWREWVINYDFSHQVRLGNEISMTTGSVQSSFRNWLGHKYRRLLNRIAGWQQYLESMSPARMGVCCGLLAVFLASPFAPRAWASFQRARRRRDPERAPATAASFWYLRLLRRLARDGVRKNAAQTPAEFTSSIVDPGIREGVALFTEHYERARFAGSVEDAQLLPDLYEGMAKK
jgi:transglutaminase-like putative cysteine protease